MPTIRTELNIAGTWTDISDDVSTREPVIITGGRADESVHVEPGSCSLTLNNRDGQYSPRNPLSPYYGLIGRNTPIRVSVPRGATYLAVSGLSGSQASTPDAAALDLTGDLDIRIDATLENWRCGDTVQLCGKYDPDSANRSWFLRSISDGTLVLAWSTNGTTVLQAVATVPIAPPPSGRLAVRATLDVNNGAGGWTATFYTASSMAGAWTQLGTAVTDVGTTSVFASAAPLDIGWAFDQDGHTAPSGRIHAMQLRNGIGGPAVASPDFTIQTPGAASFTDAAGRTWAPAGDAVLSNNQVRFTGEVSSWPPRWDVSGRDVYVPIEAAGRTRRDGQGASPLASPLRRAVLSHQPLAYWAMEDEDGATVAGSALPGGSPLLTAGFDFATDSDLPGSRPLPSIGTSMTGTVPPPPTTTLEWQVHLVARIKTAPAAGTDQELLRISSSGTVASWRIGDDATNLTLTGYSSTGTTLVSATLAHATFPGFHDGWVTVSLHAVNAGIDTAWDFSWGTVADLSSSITTGTVAGAVGHITGVATTLGAGLGDASVGHLCVFDHDVTQFEYASAAGGNAGERAGDRILRMAAEEGITAALVATADPQTDLGAQPIDTLLAVLEAAADADGGILYEQRTALALRYRDRTSLYNQPVALALDYEAPGEVAPPLEPIDDDQSTRNDITVGRSGGSSARAVLETGPLSILSPPDGVGRYDEQVTLNLHSDEQCAPIAQWQLHLGTWDEDRYPTVHVNLAAAPHLIDAAIAVDLRDLITIDNPPPWVAPDQIRLHAEGYTETLDLTAWDLVFNCVPAGPWDVAVTDDTVYGRADTDGSTLVASVTSTATTLTVQTTNPDSPLWTTDPAECPLDLRLAGEVCTATAINHGARDAFGRTVSSGWGTADSGQTWSTSGGSASDYSVGSGLGRQSNGTLASSRRTLITSPSADVDLYVTTATSALATGASQFTSLLARYVAFTDHYYARIEFTTAQACILSIRKILASVDTQLATYTLGGITHVAGTRYALRLQVAGTTLRAKAWTASGREPSFWQAIATDTSFTAAGSIGCRSMLNTGNTNALPVTVDFDDFRVLNPQAITVTRSINGVIKAQAAGADVRLAHPAITAL